MSRQLIQIFIELVKIDSSTGEEDAVAEYIIYFLSKIGFDVQKDSFGNLYARIEGIGEPVFLSAHMDTVEPGRTIHPKLENGFIISDGTTILGADNKVAVAAVLEAVTNLPANHRPLELIFTRSEEIGNYGAINFDYNLLTAKRGYCFDLSQHVGTITTASPFYERFDIALIGRSAHASHPEEAISVLPALSEILQISPRGKIEENTFFNIGVVNGGDVRNTVMGKLALNGEIRSYNNENLIRIKKTFRENVREIIERNGLEIKEDWVWENPGYQHNSKEAQDFIIQTSESIKQLGLETIITQTAGVSDANIFNDKGLICLNLGNGSEFSHTIQERVKVSELENLHRLILILATS